MKKYPVIISPTAQQELANHFDFILESALDFETAFRVTQKIEDFFLNKLAYFPEMGVRRNTVAEGIRFFHISPYGIYYFFNGDEVYISHVLHTSQYVNQTF